jgi:hypothetical protein
MMMPGPFERADGSFVDAAHARWGDLNEALRVATDRGVSARARRIRTLVRQLRRLLEGTDITFAAGLAKMENIVRRSVAAHEPRQIDS